MKLPVLIEKYIRASNDNDRESFVSCFTENATVLDDGKILTGRKSIGEWFVKNKEKYQHKTEPLSVVESENEILLNAKVSGKFEGSPVELEYSIKIQTGLIQDIRIS